MWFICVCGFSTDSVVSMWKRRNGHRWDTGSLLTLWHIVPVHQEFSVAGLAPKFMGSPWYAIGFFPGCGFQFFRLDIAPLEVLFKCSWSTMRWQLCLLLSRHLLRSDEGFRHCQKKDPLGYAGEIWLFTQVCKDDMAALWWHNMSSQNHSLSERHETWTYSCHSFLGSRIRMKWTISVLWDLDSVPQAY